MSEVPLYKPLATHPLPTWVRQVAPPGLLWSVRQPSVPIRDSGVPAKRAPPRCEALGQLGQDEPASG